MSREIILKIVLTSGTAPIQSELVEGGRFLPLLANFRKGDHAVLRDWGDQRPAPSSSGVSVSSSTRVIDGDFGQFIFTKDGDEPLTVYYELDPSTTVGSGDYNISPALICFTDSETFSG